MKKSQARERESIALMQEGLRLLASAEPSAALPLFDEVIAIRAMWPSQNDESSAWMLAGAWMNRAEALRKAVNAADNTRGVAEALQRAIALLAPFVACGSEETQRRWLLAQIEHMTASLRLGDHARALSSLHLGRCFLSTHSCGVNPAIFGELRLMLEIRALELHMDCHDLAMARACLRRAEALLPVMDTPWNRLHVQAARCRIWARLSDTSADWGGALGEDLGEAERENLPQQMRETVALALRAGAADADCSTWLRFAACWYRHQARTALFSFTVACVDLIRAHQRPQLLIILIEQWHIAKREWIALVLSGACLPEEVESLTQALSHWQALEGQIVAQGQWKKRKNDE